MKIDAKKLLKFAAFLCGGILIAAGIIYVGDQMLNGVFREWVMNTIMITYDAADSTLENRYIITEPDWGTVKYYAVLFLAANIIFWSAIIALAMRYQKKQTIEETSQLIRKYMLKTTAEDEVFSEEYEPVSLRMAQIKADIQRNEQILKEEAQRKSDLIAYLAHDLKTPLTSVIGYLSLLDEVPDMPQKQRAKYTGVTLKKAKRLEQLINEFFEITRYNLQQMVLEKETVDLYYLLVQLEDEFYPILKEHENSIRLEANENLMIYADPEKLARVFNNILKNAVAYSYRNTEIVISTEEREAEIQITFSNRGAVIPPQKLNAIFEKFFRLDDARMTNNGGAGLGLAIAKEIVALHQGTITAKSENEETSFTVVLPTAH